MAGLGLLVTFAGYLVLNYGYYLVKGRPVKLSDLALPSRRPVALGTIKAKAA